MESRKTFRTDAILTFMLKNEKWKLKTDYT